MKNILPRTLAFELTYSCNHKCLFCSCPWENEQDYIKDPSLTFDEIKNVIDIVVDNGVNFITFTGGEPTLHPNIRDIIKYAYSKRINISIITNGKNVDKDFLKFLKKYNVYLSISVPGITTFKDHTGIDNIKHVLNLFKMASKLDIITTANIAVTKKNLPELYENIAYPLLNGADYILLNRFMPGGRGMYNKEYVLSNVEINEMLTVAEEALRDAGKMGHVGTELPFCIIDNHKELKNLSVSSKCAAAKEFFVIDPSGYIKTCNHSPVKICKIFEIEKLADSPYWKRFQESDYLPDMCKKCEYHYKCDGGCRECANVNYGDVCGIDPCFDKAFN